MPVTYWYCVRAPGARRPSRASLGQDGTKGTPDLADVRVPLRGGPHPSFGIPSGASTAA